MIAGGATSRVLPDDAPGRARWHFQHGPIDLLIGADGDRAPLAQAIARARARFDGVLAELVNELPVLRRPISASEAAEGRCGLRGPIARRMWFACAPWAADAFVTPMAAVAGSVAQEIASLFAAPGIRRAWINNGGDIALVITPGERIDVAVALDRGHAVSAPHRLSIDSAAGVGGIATSGWRGRSLSRGIADAVTVLAATAAQADAAATLIANAVDVDDARIVRAPANTVRDDSDLGGIPVTVDVPVLPAAVVARALDQGASRARSAVDRGLASAVLLSLQGRTRVIGGECAASSPAGRDTAVAASVGIPGPNPVKGTSPCPV